MRKSPRCLYEDGIYSFLEEDSKSIFGVLCENYHGDVLTTTRDAWLKEIEILKNSLSAWKHSDGHIIYELEKAERQLAEQTEKIMSKIRQHKKRKIH